MKKSTAICCLIGIFIGGLVGTILYANLATQIMDAFIIVLTTLMIVGSATVWIYGEIPYIRHYNSSFSTKILKWLYPPLIMWMWYGFPFILKVQLSGGLFIGTLYGIWWLRKRQLQQRVEEWEDFVS